MHNIVFSSSLKWQKLESSVKNIAKLVLKYFKKENFYIEVNLVDNNTIRALNKKWRDKDEPTNVLSFENSLEFLKNQDKNYLGEVFLAPDYIKEKGEDFNYLLIHGLLHILGFDHIRKGDRIKMEHYENELLFYLSQWHKKHSLL